MAKASAKASATITLFYVIDIKETHRYYLLQSSTLAIPEKPTTFPPTSGGGDTLTWDGNTEGLLCQLDIYYKVSDAIVTIADLASGCTCIGGQYSWDLTITELAPGMVLAMDANVLYVALFVTEEGVGVDVNGVSISEAGVYFLLDPNTGTGTYISSLTINGYTGFGGGAAWDETEPSYIEGSTNSLYFVDCTVYTDDSFEYTPVSLSSSYEAAKTAYNKAYNAQQSLEDVNKKITQVITEVETQLDVEKEYILGTVKETYTTKRELDNLEVSRKNQLSESYPDGIEIALADTTNISDIIDVIEGEDISFGFDIKSTTEYTGKTALITFYDDSDTVLSSEYIYSPELTDDDGNAVSSILTTYSSIAETFTAPTGAVTCTISLRSDDGYVNTYQNVKAWYGNDSAVYEVTRLTSAESAILQLKNMIQTLIIDGENGSLMTQTATGWSFDMSTIMSTLNTATGNITNIQGDVSNLDSLTGELSSLTEALNTKTANIVVGSYTENDEVIPYMDLMGSDGQFKVRITSKEIVFMEGKTRVAWISGSLLYIDKVVIETELQTGGVVLKEHGSGNVGFIWKGGV